MKKPEKHRSSRLNPSKIQMSNPIEKNTHFGPENHVFSIASSGWKKSGGNDPL
jgi:hypothetical protein